MSLGAHSPVFIVLLPLSASLLCLALSRLHKHLGAWVVQLSLLGAFASSVASLREVLTEGGKTIHYWMGNWEPPIGIEFAIDPLNTSVLCMITFIALVVSFYSRPFLQNEDWLHYGGYYTLYGLLTVGLCGMTVTGDVFNMYVYLEIMSLSGYGLIALGGKKSMIAAFRYLLVGTIGASLYLIGIGYIYAMTGSLNMADIGQRIQPFVHTPLFAFAVACFLIAFGIKMALFPLHGWQPDSYTFSHPGAAGFISGCMSKVPAYAMLRYFYYVFGIHNSVMESLMNVLGIMGICGILIGSVMALAQYDFRGHGARERSRLYRRGAASHQPCVHEMLFVPCYRRYHLSLRRGQSVPPRRAEPQNACIKRGSGACGSLNGRHSAHLRILQQVVSDAGCLRRRAEYLYRGAGGQLAFERRVLFPHH